MSTESTEMSYAEASLFDDDDLCRHGRVICRVCAAEEDFDDEEFDEDDDD
jgi:hypothetical protein